MVTGGCRAGPADAVWQGINGHYDLRGGKLGITILGMFGPVFLFGIYLLLCVLQIDSPFLHSHLQADLDRAMLSPALRKAFDHKDMPLSPGAMVTVVQTGQLWQINTASQTYTVRRTPHALQIDRMELWDGHADAVFFSLTAALFLFNLLVMDVNLTSAHGFYRDRLSKAYLMHLRPDGDIESNDTQRLSDLNQPGTAAPYHLINVALNLQQAAIPIYAAAMPAFSSSANTLPVASVPASVVRRNCKHTIRT